MPLPNAPVRKKTGRRKGQTRVYTNTPVRNEIAERTKEKNAKKSKKAAPKKVKKRLFPQKKRITKQIEAPSSSSDEMEIPYDDESDWKSKALKDIARMTTMSLKVFFCKKLTAKLFQEKMLKHQHLSLG